MRCRIALAQVEPTLGNLAHNLEMHRREIDAAVSARADLVLFPELSLTGYFLKDLTSDVALELDSAPVAELVERSRAVSIAFGFVERARDGRIYNSLAFLEDGEVVDVHRKVHLVNYGMFEEQRDLAAGERFRPIESKHGRFGLLICEDMWHVGASWLHFLAGVDAILVASASPGRGVTGPATGLRSVRTWNTLQDALAILFQTWIVYANRVGSEDGIQFAGASRVVDPSGVEVAALPPLEPGRLVHTIGDDALRRARVSMPLRRDEKPWIVARELAKLQAHDRSG